MHDGIIIDRHPPGTAAAMSAVAFATTPAVPADHGLELKRGALTNTIAILASNFRGIFAFLIARLLGPAALGLFMVAWNAVEILSKLSLFGLENTTIAFIARAEATGDRARSRSLFRLVVFLALAQSLFVAAVSLLVLQIFGHRFGLDRSLTTSLSIMLCALPGMSLYGINTAVSRGMKVMRHDIFSRGITESTVTSLVFLVAVALGAPAFGPAVAAVVGASASGIVALILARSLFRSAPRRPAEFSYGTEARRLLSFSAHISGYELLNAIIVRMDVIMLAAFIGRAPGVSLITVGIYTALVEVANGLRKVNQAFNPIFAPIVAGLTVDGDQKRAAVAFSRVSQWMLWVLLPIVAVMILAGSVILGIYGPAFREGGMWLGIVAIACATNAFVSLAETVIMVQKPGLNLLNSIITAVVALIANLWLISRFGVTGAAFGILLPYVLQGILRYRALRMVFRWQNPWQDISHPLIAAAVAAAPALSCRIMIEGTAGQLVASGAFLLVYGAAWLYSRRSEPPARLI